MSLAFEQFSQLSVNSAILDSPLSRSALPYALLALSQDAAIYSGDVCAVTAAITSAIVKKLSVTSCQVWTYADQRNLFKPIAHCGATDSCRLSVPIAVVDYSDYFYCLAQRPWLIINTGQASGLSTHNVISGTHNNTQSTAQATLPPYIQEQSDAITALVEIPIYHQDQVVGVLCCGQQQSPRVWKAIETSFLISAACLIALTISHASNQKQQHALIQQKRQLTLEVIERQQAAAAWQESQRFIRGIVDASTNILYVSDFSTGTNYYVNSYIENILGYSPEEIKQLGSQFLEKLAHPETIEVIHQTRQSLAQSDRGKIIENEYRLRHKQGGWLWMLCRETIFQWNQDGAPSQLLGTATDVTVHKEKHQALQLQNQELTTLARLDALTQIANRRAFDEFLEQVWIAGNRTPLALILCDIDYFKLYNDNYGHQAGDVCLQKVAQALKKSVKRRLDLVARYGGEEFAIVLPNTTSAEAQHVAKAIQVAVGELEIEHYLSDVSNYLTVSLGIATVSLTVNKACQTLIAAADRGLYQAKSNGRNQFAMGCVDISDPLDSMRDYCQ